MGGSIASMVMALLIQYKVEHTQVVYNQFVIESGSGTSRLAREQNNIFGMRCVKSRTTTQSGCKSGFGVYKSIGDAVLDMRLWQLQNGARGLSEKDYIKYLRNVYIKDKKYLDYWYK